MKDLTNKMLNKLADSIVGKKANQQKLLAAEEKVTDVIPAQQDNQMPSCEERELIERTKYRLFQQEVNRQRNLEDILEKADAALSVDGSEQQTEQEVDGDWFKQFTNYAQDISNEDLRTLWARILANEVKRPDTYSLRTLDFLRLLSKKEAEVIRSMAQFVLYDVNDDAYILNSRTTEEFKFNEIMILMELGLLDNSSGLAINVEKRGAPTINFFLHHQGTGLFVFTEQEKLFVHIYKLTSMGKEIMALNDNVPLNINYVKDYVESAMKSDSTMTATCAPIVKWEGNNVNLDEEHAYFKLGPKNEKKEGK